MYTLTCTGKDGINREFNYQYSQDQFSNKWVFKVTNIPPLQNGDFFEMTLTPLDDETLRVTMINHHNIPEYMGMGMGIPDALLPTAKLVLGKNIESSPSQGTQSDVYRTPAATRVWERLKENKCAIYDSEHDIYRLA